MLPTPDSFSHAWSSLLLILSSKSFYLTEFFIFEGFFLTEFFIQVTEFLVQVVEFFLYRYHIDILLISYLNLLINLSFSVSVCAYMPVLEAHEDDVSVFTEAKSKMSKDSSITPCLTFLRQDLSLRQKLPNVSLFPNPADMCRMLGL